MNARTRRPNLTMITGAGLVAAGIVGLGVHLSSGSDASSTVRLAASQTGTVSVTCPDVAGKIGAVPAAAQSGVSQELANLERQITNVNDRLAREPGQAQNQLNDLAGKRSAVIDRIILDFTRLGATAPAGLRDLVDCTLSTGAAGAGGGAAGGGAAGGGAATAAPTVPPAEEAGGGAADGAQTVNCPAVEGALPAIPASAANEVTRNLALLQTQIGEANARLAKIFIKPEGGPAFIQNAILGPLEDKRFATLNRIATAIGRTAARPDDLQDLAPCSLNDGGAAGEAPPAATTEPAAPATVPPASGGGATAAQTVNCPAVEGALPAVPASAANEVTRNLALLQTQIGEANARLAKIFIKPEGGPAFIQNAILGPLEDKRFATLNRIATAIGRTAARPDGLQDLAPCGLNS